MLNIKSNLVMLLFVMVSFEFCFAQDFDGTNLSSSKLFYGELPYVFEGSENYWITFKTDPQIIRKLVPEPLKPISDSEMTMIFARHRIISPSQISYHEAYLMTSVSYEATYAGYIPVLYLDKVETIIPAREIWGFNKVGADFQFDESDNQVSITVAQ